MQIKAVISMFLAVWLGLGVSLMPKFQCLCADGTQTVELGKLFCCDGPDGDLQTCAESNEVSHESMRCTHGGCESTPMPSDVVVLSNRDGDHKTDTASATNQIYDTVMFAQQRAFPPPHRPAHELLRCPQAIELFQIRSVILRV